MAAKVETKDLFRSAGAVLDRIILSVFRVTRAVSLALVEAIREEVGRGGGRS